MMKMKQEKKKLDVQLQAMWFAAGTAAVMACLQRAILVSFMEQWRMLVFLALNLLLLAILFTSTHNINNNPITPSISSSPHENTQEIINNCSLKLEIECKKKKNFDDPDDEIEDLGRKTEKVGDVIENEDQNVMNFEAQPQQELSKEELNKRAEAFIAMFRQHLVSDAKVGKRNYSVSKGG